ncbi:MAG TPA: type II secretion system protein [Methylobacter sp.]|jgi:prepilin-type N-terminal cleavage/methylation domain-containing protein
MAYSYTRLKGFTLVEMAIVLVIVGLILGGIMMPLSVQMDQHNATSTRATIANVQEALIGYAMANGRFPCPAVAGATGVEAFAAGGAGTGICANLVNAGFVPGVTLGVSPTNANGYVVDGWNNPIRYAIVPLTNDAGASYIFTKSLGMKNAGISWIALQSLLSVCNTSTGIGATTCSGAATTLTNSAVLVIFSQGKNFPTIGIPDEQANNVGDVFIDHTPNPTGAANGEYDDIMSWVSINTVFSRMVQAGQLP